MPLVLPKPISFPFWFLHSFSARIASNFSSQQCRFLIRLKAIYDMCEPKTIPKHLMWFHQGMLRLYIPKMCNNVFLFFWILCFILLPMSYLIKNREGSIYPCWKLGGCKDFEGYPRKTTLDIIHWGRNSKKNFDIICPFWICTLNDRIK